MRVWRIALERFAKDKRSAFSGQSGFAVDGRWHTNGRYLDYAAESLSLATLERLVHYKRFDSLAPHVVYELDIPSAAIGKLASLPKGWDGAEPLPQAQAIGNNWCDSGESAALLVPSAVTAGEYNLMLNARHPDWRWTWVIAGPDRFVFDARLQDLIRQKK